MTHFWFSKTQEIPNLWALSFSTLLRPAGIEDKENIVEGGGEFELLDGGAEK